MATFEKIVVVTRKTRLQELIERFNTHGQAKFYIEHAGGDFAEYVSEDDAYRRSLDALHDGLEVGLKVQTIDRWFLPTFLFSERDLVVTAGQDGLVANTAKYVGAQPIVAVNPDPARIDGILLPFGVDGARAAVRETIAGKASMRQVTLGEVKLNDGQRLLAFNDFYVGAQSHVSSRYKISVGGVSEAQSSSGVLVSTGAGSTGWLSSVFNMSEGVSGFLAGGASSAKVTRAQSGRREKREVKSKGLRLDWEDPRLVFVVREPFASRHSDAGIIAGMLEPGEEIVLESLMPSAGVVFSDGVDADFLPFNAGAIAHVRAAPQRARLVVAT